MAKVILEVQAGIIPGQPEPEFTRRWSISSEEWEAAQSAGLHDHGATMPVLRTYGEATEYARMLWNPGRLNWVRLDWLYP